MSYLIFVLVLWAVGSLGVGYLVGKRQGLDEGVRLTLMRIKSLLRAHELVPRKPDVSRGRLADERPILVSGDERHGTRTTEEEFREMYGRRQQS